MPEYRRSLRPCLARFSLARISTGFPGRRTSVEWRRYAAPAAFLLAATIAVVLIRSGLESGNGARATTPTVTRHPTTRPTPRYWTVRAGDTFGSIAGKAHVSVATLKRLNPHVRPTALTIGERIRLR